MRRICSVLRSTNSGFSLPFQRFQGIKTSSDYPHIVLVETSTLVHGSNIQCHGKSYAASAASDKLEARKPRRRLTKDERKSMVDNFVKKYREMNAGRFPTASDAVKYVGGSYYVVREILQELKYNSQKLSMETKDTSSLKRSSVKMDEISTDSGEVSQTRDSGELMNPISKGYIEDTSSKIVESKEGPQSPISVQSDKSNDVGPQSHQPVVEQYDPENNKKQEIVHEDRLKMNDSQSKAELQESTESQISGRELHKVPIEDAEPQGKSSVWQNLKSFASGILGIWKRS